MSTRRREASALAAAIAVRPPELSAGDDAHALALGDDDAGAQRQLPAFDPAELTRAVGFVRVVRRFVALPLLVLGVLATGAAVATAHPLTAALAGIVTFALQWSLRDDMRVAHALDLARRGKLPVAQRQLLAIAAPAQAGGPTRQRARVVLAAIAWQRGQLEPALAWIMQAQAHERGPAADPDRVVELGASEVLLLALLGRGEEAALRLGELPASQGTEQVLWRIHVELLTAFAQREVSQVRERLDGWSELVGAHDSVGVTSALMAWAYAAAGRHDEAATWIARAHAGLDPTLLRTRYHALAAHLDSLAATHQWSRR
jgi:tetratricopeptide (TPR) repeat protein